MEAITQQREQIPRKTLGLLILNENYDRTIKFKNDPVDYAEAEGKRIQ